MTVRMGLTDGSASAVVWEAGNPYKGSKTAPPVYTPDIEASGAFTKVVPGPDVGNIKISVVPGGTDRMWVVAPTTNRAFEVTNQGLYQTAFLSSTDGGTTFTNLANGNGVFGSTTPALVLSTLTSAQNSSRYRAVFTNSAGSANSTLALLNVT